MKITKDDSPLPKCYFTHCTIPKYTDQARPPTKQQPFKAFLQHSPAHTVDLILPDELYTLVEQTLAEKTFSYARVFMSLLDIVSGDFFSQYVKAGNVVMMSEGVAGVQNTYSLKDGILTLDVDKATYERCGLVGSVTQSAGRKYIKSRFKIELDLRLQSMQHGKKGFERIKHAFKTVLNESLAWLFVDLENEDVASGPIATLHPQVKELKPTISSLTCSSPPFMSDEDAIQDPLYEEQLLEWLGLVTLNSSRINISDNADSYICKYAPPEAVEDDDNDAVFAVKHLRWHGFASSTFIRHLWLILRAGTKDQDKLWFSLGGKTFAGTSFTVLCHDGQSVLLWECD